MDLDASQAKITALEAENARFRTSVLNAKGIIANLEMERDAAREQVKHEVKKRKAARAESEVLIKENQALSANVVHQENVKLKKQLKAYQQNADEDRNSLWNAERRIEKLTKKNAKHKKRRREERDIADEAARLYQAEIKRLKETVGELMAQLDEVLGTEPIEEEA